MILVKQYPTPDDIPPFHLDTPKHKDSSTQTTVAVRGWMSAPPDSIRLIVRSDDKTRDMPFNEERPEIAAQLPPNTSDLHVYGFNYELTITTPIMIGARLAGKPYWCFAVARETNQTKALVGYSGYLFLNNDTNDSVSQYTGEFKAEEKVFTDWEKYFSENKNENMQFLLAPAKEELFPDFYPYPRGTNTFIDQYLKKFGEHINYPLKELFEYREMAYRSTDTHWSDFGALIAAKTVLQRFGIPHSNQTLNPTFRVAMTYGDLGNKMKPMQQGPVLKMVNTPNPAFNNQIPNHGKIWAYINNDAPVNKTLHIYGDSFASNLAPILSLMFKKTVLLHTAGQPDQSVIVVDKPDYVLCQTNQRFVATVPSPISIWNLHACSLKKLTF
ncbi:MAG: hypothetical protein JXX14_02605 [Deltaproteobacteria bacterium]|nr:hypothetical protein [Deltaproteobacteria bacterium]